jgi:hypothetical protein
LLFKNSLNEFLDRRSYRPSWCFSQ